MEILISIAVIGYLAVSRPFFKIFYSNKFSLNVSWLNLSVIAGCIVFFLLPTQTKAVSNTGESLHLQAFAPPQEMVWAIGNAWYIYLDGPIDRGAAQRLETFLQKNNVPELSTVVLNSPGGNLFEGMAIGRVIRKYRLNTNVGKRLSTAKEYYSFEPGICYSACSIAFLGGKFRYLTEKSKYGVHRFSFPLSTGSDTDISQIVSAEIMNYLRSMSIDVELFTHMTKAGPNEIMEINSFDRNRLRVTNNGFEEPKWSIESSNGLLYLRGERDTKNGINKWLVYCEKSSRKLFVHVIFDPQQRDDEAMKFSAHSLVLGEKEFSVQPRSKKIVNGWFNGTYELSRAMVAEMGRSKHVGLRLQFLHNAPVFLGFDYMPFQEGSVKLSGIVNSCY
jgi:ATP-dependent protease ClpP protease subunit